MFNISITSSEEIKTVNSSSLQLQSKKIVNEEIVRGSARQTVAVVFDLSSNIPKCIDLSIRPNIEENAMKVQRVNRELELGYCPPVQPTYAK